MCIKKHIILKNRLWKENKLTWGEDLELSNILHKTCSYAEVDVQEVADAALKKFSMETLIREGV
jgi:hypothetical protein